MATDNQRKPNPAAKLAPEFEERVRLRAYELYEERGKEDGHDLEDWIRAEEELMSARIIGIAA